MENEYKTEKMEVETETETQNNFKENQTQHFLYENSNFTCIVPKEILELIVKPLTFTEATNIYDDYLWSLKYCTKYGDKKDEV